MSKSFEELKKEIQDGIDGKNSGIPMGFRRLNNYISIRKSMYYLLGGYTGSGKTSLLDDAFVLNPMDYMLKEQPEGVDLEIIYFSMERKKSFKLAKWICRKIFYDEGIVIPLHRMFGWVDKSQRLTKDEHDLFLGCEEYIDLMENKVTIIQGPQNPTGFRKYVETVYAPSRGELVEIDKFHKEYIPKNPNLITLIISDHIGLITKEKDLPSKKDRIDKSSEDKQRWRDLYGFSPVDVSQFNRDIANPIRIKNGDVQPALEDFKDSGSTQENADAVLTLFDPMRYKVPDPNGYDLERLRDETGKKKYRSLQILKNSYGGDDVGIGLAFQPEVGTFKELPKITDITGVDYDHVLNNKYFL